MTAPSGEESGMAINSLRPLKPDEFDYWAAHHLLSRAGFGGTPGQVRALANLALDDAVSYIVDYAEIPYEPVEADRFDADIMHPPTEEERRAGRAARQSGDEVVLERLRRERQRRQRADRRQIREIQQWWLTRLIETPRPLEEKMTLFWHGHFATGYRTIEDSYHMYLQNQLFRANAAGSFRTLAHGIIHDPAMLRYLNNNQNRRARPNENLARELMELFTLGEGNAYGEQDIKEGARALTGYTYRDDEFVFRERMHDPRAKRILGQRGAFDGDDFVDIILAQRFTSEFICLKLYKFFVNDLPNGPDKATQGFITKLARKFRESDYDVTLVLRTLFRSAHFYDASNVAAQIKSPTQLIVQTIRSWRTPVRSLRTLNEASDLMGQSLLFPPSVKGWDGGRSWINTSTLFVRQNVVVYLLTGRRPESRAWESDGAPFDATHLVEHLASAGGEPAPADAARYLLRFGLGAEPHPARVKTLTDFIDACGGHVDNTVLVGLLSLIAGMPEYQLC
jgi:uncharacterized protein (DUF1800 family)